MEHIRNGKLGLLPEQLVWLTDRSNECTKYGVPCAYQQESVLADTQLTKQLETNCACEDLLRPPLRQLSNGSCAFGNERYSDLLFPDDAIRSTQPTTGESYLDLRSQQQTINVSMQTTRPQTPGHRRHNAQILAVEVHGLPYNSTPTLTTSPVLQHEFLEPYGQVSRNSHSQMVGKFEHLSVQHKLLRRVRFGTLQNALGSNIGRTI
jgi:hypothetical protein